MHPYAVDRMVQERQAELARLAGADRRARDDSVPTWRRTGSGALVALAVALGVPRPGRAAVRRQVRATLGLEPPC